MKLRSLLFIPSLEDRFWGKVLKLGEKVGGFIFDLEDSISDTAKDEARNRIANNINLIKKTKEKHVHLNVGIRINNIESHHFKRDLDFIRYLEKDRDLVDFIMYPKAKDGKEIDNLYNIIKNKKIKIFIVIENLKAFMNRDILLRPEKRVAWTAIGAEDLCADLNIDRPVNFYINPILSHIAAEIAILSKYRKIGFWGNIWPYLEVAELLPFFIDEMLTDNALGAIGKVIFHPYQIDLVNSIIKSEAHDVMTKRSMLGRIKAISKRAEETGLTVALYNGRMVDLPEMIRLKKWMDEELSIELKKKISKELPDVKKLLNRKR